MTYDETLDQLDRWAGREVCAAVRTPSDGQPALVAVMLGSLGAVQTNEARAAFVPIGVSEKPPLGRAVGLRLGRADFESATGDAAHLHLRLRDAAVEVAST